MELNLIIAAKPESHTRGLIASNSAHNPTVVCGVAGELKNLAKTCSLIPVCNRCFKNHLAKSADSFLLTSFSHQRRLLLCWAHPRDRAF